MPNEKYFSSTIGQGATVVISHRVQDGQQAAYGGRKRLIAKVRPLLVKDDDFVITNGLDFWFMPEGAKAKVPVRWKQFFITWSAIYPLSMLGSLTINPPLCKIGMPQERFFDTLCVSGVIVPLMVYLVMPRYTKMVQRWLSK